MFERFASGEATNGPQAAPGWVALSGRSRGFVQDRRFGPADRRQPAPADDEINTSAIALEEARAAGRAEAEAEFAERECVQAKLRSALAMLDSNAQEKLAARLAETVALLCERTLEPLALDGELLRQRCTKAVRALGDESKRLTLHLHPDDVPLLDETFADGLVIEPDTALERGALRLDGLDGSVLDGPEQWRAAIAAALGCDSK